MFFKRSAVRKLPDVFVFPHSFVLSFGGRRNFENSIDVHIMGSNHLLNVLESVLLAASLLC